MTRGEMWYLVMVLVAFAVFTAVLAHESWQQRKARRAAEATSPAPAAGPIQQPG